MRLNADKKELTQKLKGIYRELLDVIHSSNDSTSNLSDSALTDSKKRALYRGLYHAKKLLSDGLIVPFNDKPDGSWGFIAPPCGPEEIADEHMMITKYMILIDGISMAMDALNDDDIHYKYSAFKTRRAALSLSVFVQSIEKDL